MPRGRSGEIAHTESGAIAQTGSSALSIGLCIGSIMPGGCSGEFALTGLAFLPIYPITRPIAFIAWSLSLGTSYPRTSVPAADSVLGSQRLAKPLGKSQTVREDNALAVAPFRSRSCVSGLLAIVHFTLPVSPRWTVSHVGCLQ